MKAAEKARGLEQYGTRDRALDHAKTVYDTLFGYVKSLAEVGTISTVLASEVEQSYAAAARLGYHQWQHAFLDLMLDIALQRKHNEQFLKFALSAAADLKQHVREKDLGSKVEYIETRLGLVPYTARLKKLAKEALRWFNAPPY